ncbi:MAG: carbohydrate porin [Hyphomicrobiaceae bacterium]
MAQEADSAETGIPEPSIATSLPANGDPFGRRAALAARGVRYNVNYGAEVFGVADGGIKSGSQYVGQLEGIVNIDFEKLTGWNGLTFRAHGYQLHGRGISIDRVGVLNGVSSLEATPSTRLFELWFEQDLIKDKLSVRAGQLRVDYDGEFLTAPSAGLFMNNDFGWSALMATNLPSGGLGFPIIAPGIRVKAQPSDAVALLFAVYNDDPAGPCEGDPQVCNTDGLKFRLRDNPFAIGEIQYKYGSNATPSGLNGLLKVGTFVDLGKFDDKRIGTDGLSLASLGSNGIAHRYHENHGFYGVVDQQIYRPPASASADNGVFVFGRMAGLPSDRNLVDLAFDAGIRFNGLIAARPSDEFGVGVHYNRISNRVSSLDRDAIAATGVAGPIHGSEYGIELTYKAQTKPGLTLQPDLQYVWNPGGHAPDPNNPSKAIDSALIVGLRSVVSY